MAYVQTVGAQAAHTDWIKVHAARVHNLKNLSVSIPLGQWTAVVGVSGAGKSSLVFDTLHAESQRRFIETLSPSSRLYLQQLERPDVDRIDQLPPSVAVGRSRDTPAVQARVAERCDLLDHLALLAIQTGQTFCPQCECPVDPDRIPDWLARIDDWPDESRIQIAVGLHVKHPDATVDDAFKQQWSDEGYHRFWDLSAAERDGENSLLLGDVASLVVIDRLTAAATHADRTGESLEQALTAGGNRCFLLVESNPVTPQLQRPSARLIDDRQREWTVYALSAERRCGKCGTLWPEPQPALFRRGAAIGACALCQGSGMTDAPAGGAASKSSKRKQPAIRCQRCNGWGISPYALAVLLPANGSDKTDPRISLERLLGQTVQQCRSWINQLDKTVENHPATVGQLIGGLGMRLRTLIDIGLGELELSRTLRSLSAGESQRLRLTEALGSQLVNTLFLLDEPGHGLHPQDCQQLRPLLAQLRDLGNTVVTIDHEPELISGADYVVELGPEAGTAGGEVVFAGTRDEFLTAAETPTARWLRNDFRTKESSGRPVDGTTKFLAARQIRCHNVLGVDLEIPLQHLTVISGVCGSGKTSLLCETIYPHLAEQTDRQIGSLESLTGTDSIDETILIDAVELNASQRSTPATYLKAYDEIRKLFAGTVDAKTRGYTAGRFSFNSGKAGRCETCAGLGQVELDLHFLPNMWTVCLTCQGQRFNPETLEVKYRSRNIADVLNMTAQDAFTFFRKQPKLQRILQTIRNVGLGYVPLGQPTTQLSQGELQRLKLASFLSAATGKQTLFVFDEPSTGLHPTDVATLINCLHQLVEQGHTAVVIDNHRHVIEQAEWLIEMGPGSGSAGGQILYSGPPPGNR